MKYCNARVSTHEQNLDVQLDALERVGCDQIFTDMVSGVQNDRTGPLEALETTQEGDTLTVWRLDRLGRSLRSLIDIKWQVEAKGAEFESISEGVDTSTSGCKLYFRMMGALSQFEHDLKAKRQYR